MTLQIFTEKTLKELYTDQCSPCISGYPECGGDPEKAKAWKCPRFHNGLFLLS